MGYCRAYDKYGEEPQMEKNIGLNHIYCMI